ncbi:MAG: TonB-dependent receptor [Bacteroidia bacterium]|nr:TonB-dependent receptor [Bacteroidia bacterium]
MKQFFTLLGVVWTVACWALAPSGIAAEGTGNRAWLQSTTISGAVADEDGNPLVGATVQAFNTQQNRVVAGGYTDADGRFSIQLASTADVVIRISYVGYRTEEVALSQGVSALEVQLQLDAAGLDEVLVVGYTTAYKRDITGSVATVRGADIENLPVNTLENALQGRMAGVQITQGSGKLGQGITIRVRGAASVSASSQPLYVIDGIIVTTDGRESITGEATNPIAELNPNDVESVQVLKDASAAAIYGSRASNGVVIITTKRGKAGKTQANIGYFYAFQSPAAKNREFLNADEYVQFFTQANGGVEVFSRDAFLPGRNFETNWQDEVLQNSNAYQVDFNVSGGTDKTQVYFSAQYLDQEGILVGNAFNRISARLSFDHKANDWIKFGITSALSRTRNQRVQDDNAFSSPMQAVALSPLTPRFFPTDEDPALRQAYIDAGIVNPSGQIYIDPIAGYYNYFNELSDGFQNASVIRNLTTAYAEFSLIPWLTYRATMGADVRFQTEEIWKSRYTLDGAPTTTFPLGGLSYSSYDRAVNITTNHTVNFARQFGQHTVSALVGFEYQDFQATFNSVTGENLGDPSFVYVSSATDFTGGSSGPSDYSFVSYFSQANYKYKDRYLLTVSARVDGSSRFGTSSRYGFFPAASVGWVLSEEEFLQGLSAVSFLKLRASYGVTGNAEIGNLARFGLVSQVQYRDQAAFTPGSIQPDDYQWETSTTFEVGIDWGLFDNRISGVVAWYDRQTTDLLLSVNVPADLTTGPLTTLRNIGSLQNRGIEIEITSNNLIGAFKWSTTLNFASNRNQILDLQGQILTAGRDAANRAIEGQPIGSFFLPLYAGVDPSNGDALFVAGYNADGTPILTDDFFDAPRFLAGDPNPDFTGGVINNFSFKGFDLSVFFQFSYGNEIYNGAGRFMTSNGWFADNQTREQLSEAWTTPGQITNVPRLDWNSNNGARASSRYIYDGSYLRLKTLTFGYTLPQQVVERLKVRSIRVYFSGQNLLTFTDYPGWDPEVSSLGQVNIGQGQDFYTAPQIRSAAFGVNIGL